MSDIKITAYEDCPDRMRRMYLILASLPLWLLESVESIHDHKGEFTLVFKDTFGIPKQFLGDA